MTVFLVHWTIIGSSSVTAQTASRESLITAYVYQLTEAIQWREVTEQRTLNLNYYGDNDTLLGELSNLEARGFEGFTFAIERTPTMQEAVKDANIILVDEGNRTELAELFELIGRRSILVITVNAADRKLPHINLLSVDNRITFELNRYTLAYNYLPIDIDVMVLGGQEVDIAELLKELQAEVAVKEGQLVEVNTVIASQQQTIQQQLIEIAESEQNLTSIRQQLAMEGEEVAKLERQIAVLNLDVETARNTLEANNQTIREREQALASQLEDIARNEQLIAQQQAEIQEQNKTIRNTAEMLSQQQVTIAEQTEQIQRSDQLITTQNLVISVIVVLMMIILLVFVAFLRRSKKLRQTHQILLETKDQLVESEKMASLGFLVAGVAHEMNTPLGNLITASTSLEYQLEEAERLLNSEKPSRSELFKTLENSREATRLIQNNQKRAANLISRFKELSASELQKESKQNVVKKLLEEAYHFHLSGQDKNRLTLELNCPDDLVIRCNAGAFTNVSSQLMSNAAIHGDASKGDKTLLKIDCEQQGSSILLRFVNDGKPLTSEETRQLFEPFYTTKRHEGLIGLGLHICYNIVNNHLGGYIKYESNPDSVCFVVTLPIGV